MSIGAPARRWGDVALAGGLGGGLTLELFVNVPSVGMGPVWCGLLGTVPLALRRHTPVLAFVLSMTGLHLLGRLLPGFEDQTALYVLTYFVGLYSLGRHATGAESWLGAAAVACALALFVYEDARGFDLGAIVWAAALLGAPWAAGVALRLRREREAVMESAAETLREEHQENLKRRVAIERATIARELHDVVAHAIAVTVLQARGARRVMSSDEEAARRALDAIEHTNTQALGDMRRLLAALRETDTWPEGAHDAVPQPSLSRLDDLLEQVRSSGLDVEVTAQGVQRDVPPGVDLSAYRIIQEALTNVIKHAGAKRAWVRLRYTEQHLGITITDDGVTRPPPEQGNGLLGIRERVAVVGGDVTFGTGTAGGFELAARLPYALEES